MKTWPVVGIHCTEFRGRLLRFNTSEVWFDILPCYGYGDREIPIWYLIRAPFVTSSDPDQHIDYGLSADEARANLVKYRALGGEINPGTFNQLRAWGYDTLVDNEGICALYPSRVVILGQRAKYCNGDIVIPNRYRRLVCK